MLLWHIPVTLQWTLDANPWKWRSDWREVLISCVAFTILYPSIGQHLCGCYHQPHVRSRWRWRNPLFMWKLVQRQQEGFPHCALHPLGLQWPQMQDWQWQYWELWWCQSGTTWHQEKLMEQELMYFSLLHFQFLHYLFTPFKDPLKSRSSHINSLLNYIQSVILGI